MNPHAPSPRIHHFRVFRGLRWWYPVIWLEQTDGPQLLPHRVPFSEVDEALKHACRMSNGEPCEVTVEWQGGVRDAFAFGPRQAA
ncbi:MAG: hypothetical protein ACR2OZ_16935 [Verrucomicrobiales bacterium]